MKRHARTELIDAVEVVALFGVSARTVIRWARAGRLRTIQAPGGPLHFFADEILMLLEDVQLAEVKAVVLPFSSARPA